MCELMPYLAAVATKEWCFKEERVLNTMLLEFCILFHILKQSIIERRRSRAGRIYCGVDGKVRGELAATGKLATTMCMPCLNAEVTRGHKTTTTACSILGNGASVMRSFHCAVCTTTGFAVGRLALRNVSVRVIRVQQCRTFSLTT